MCVQCSSRVLGCQNASEARLLSSKGGSPVPKPRPFLAHRPASHKGFCSTNDKNPETDIVI